MVIKNIAYYNKYLDFWQENTGLENKLLDHLGDNLLPQPSPRVPANGTSDLVNIFDLSYGVCMLLNGWVVVLVQQDVN